MSSGSPIRASIGEGTASDEWPLEPRCFIQIVTGSPGNRGPSGPRALHSSERSKVTPVGLVDLLRLIENGTLSNRAAKDVFERTFETGERTTESTS
ncbi:MAG: hypothetical protein ACREOS_13130 [Candidatus Dormibacteraceae bacterium]